MPKTEFPVFAIFLLVYVCTLFRPTPANAQRFSPLSYIESNKSTAIKYMQEYGVPASVILAVAMHESAHGNSKIARYLNNHFGIKGKNESKEIRSAYKGYGSVLESYDDFVNCLRNRDAFSHLFGKFEANDYRSWTRGIARGGYASSKSWFSQVVGMIEKYQLYLYDSLPDTPGNQNQQAQETPVLQHAATSAEQQRIYAVKKGDTLSEIAVQHGQSVADIRKKNELRSSRLKIGQKLLL